MAARTTGAKVKNVVTTNLDAATIESDFIDLATAIVDEQLVGSGLTNKELEKIELYLAAHFVAITEELGGLVSDSSGVASQRMSDAYRDGGLRLTRYGQQALALDTTGTLQSKYAPKQKAEFRTVQTPRYSEIDG